MENKSLRRYLSRHGIYVDFTPFAVLGDEFMARVADKTSELVNTYAPRNAPPAAWYHIRRTLDWLSKNLGAMFPDIAAKLKENKKPTEKEWQSVVSAFRSQLMAPAHINRITTASDTSKSTTIYSVRAFFKHLAQQDILPHVKLQTIPRVEKMMRPKKGVAERPRLYGDVVEVVNSLLDKDTGGTPITKEQRTDYIKTLYSEGENPGSDKDVLDALVELNNKRLADLRQAMEKQLLSEYDIFQRGQKLLDLCDISYEEDILPALTEYNSDKKTRRPTAFSSLFDKNVSDEMMLARLLTLIVDRWNGMVPKADNCELGTFVFSRSARVKTSLHELRQLVGASADALIAAYTIILVDTGKNAKDIEDVAFNCMEDTEDPGIKKLISKKGRSGNKEMETFLRVQDENQISAVRAIEIIQEMTQRVRTVASGTESDPLHLVKVRGKDVRDKLFIHRCKKKDVIVAGFHTINASMKLREVCNRYDSLKGIHFTFDCIRPSVILKRYLKGDLDAGIAQSDLVHTTKKPTTGYVMRYVSKVALEREIRRFQDQFEAVMIADIPKAAYLLGYASEEFERLLTTAMRSGLGCVCLRKIAVRQEETTVAENCNLIEDCNSCTDMRIAVTSKANLVDAILLDRHLENNHDEMEGNNPDRFVAVWMPNWARAKATIELAKTMPGVNRQLIKEAETMADNIGGGFPPMF